MLKEANVTGDLSDSMFKMNGKKCSFYDLKNPIDTYGLNNKYLMALLDIIALDWNIFGFQIFWNKCIHSRFSWW